MTKKNCQVCLGAHDREIHRATLEVRQWFRGEVLASLEMPADASDPKDATVLTASAA